MHPSQYIVPEIVVDKALGYEYFMDKAHPLASKSGRVWYHRHVASVKIGRWVLPEEVVHHKDDNRANNSPDNLEVWASQSEHASHHAPAPKPPLPCERCGKPASTGKRKYCSYGCATFARRKVIRPSKEELQDLLQRNSWVAVGRMFGVSDNAVRKWAKNYNLPP